MLSVSNRLAQQLLGADFSTGFTSQKESTGALCEVLKLVLQPPTDGLSDSVFMGLLGVINVWHSVYL